MDGDAAPKELDRHHEEALPGVSPHHDALHVGQRPVGDAHPLPFPEIGIGKDRKLGADELPNGGDLRIGDAFEPVPALAEHSHQPSRLTDLEMVRFVHGVAQEEIAPEQRNATPNPHSATPRPNLGRREEEIKALWSELIVYEPLAIAARPQHAPGRGRRLRLDFWQGFAPFGLHPFAGV